MKKGDTIFVGQYLFTGSETTSVWLEVRDREPLGLMSVAWVFMFLSECCFSIFIYYVQRSVIIMLETDLLVWNWFHLSGVEQVSEVKGEDVVCVCKNSATLAGSLFTLHASQVHIELPTLSDRDKEVSLELTPFIDWWMGCTAIISLS